MKPIETGGRCLAVHPTTYGLGFAVFEGPFRLIDWGTYRARGDKNRKCLVFLDALIKRYEPRIALIENREPRERQRNERIRRLVRSAQADSRRRGLALERIPRRDVRALFERYGANTKHAIARRIVELFPELSHYLPPVRKPWMPEHPSMGMFDAIALALTYFDSLEIGSQGSPSPNESGEH